MTSDDLLKQWQERQKAKTPHCQKCSAEIEPKRVQYALDRGGEAKYCYTCSLEERRKYNAIQGKVRFPCSPSDNATV